MYVWLFLLHFRLTSSNDLALIMEGTCNPGVCEDELMVEVDDS